jgi:HSP20 family protein
MNAPSILKQLTPSRRPSVFGAFSPLSREMNRFFDEIGDGWEAFTEFRLAPSMDVVEAKDGLEINVELPGLARDDIKIAIDGDTLTVSGEKKAESETKDRRYRIYERSYGEFSRSVRLPRNFDGGKIKAVMADGVLKITAPKRADAETKTIEIQSA